MPEGDTLYIVAERLRPVLVGNPVASLELRVGRGERFGPPRTPLVAVPEVHDTVIDAVFSRGKHLVIELGRFALRTHLGMSGTWHRYDTGARWQLPRKAAGVILRVPGHEVVCFKPPTVSIGRVRDIQRELLHLGPDLLAPQVDWDAVLANATVRPERPIVDVLMDQRVAAGIGNVYKNEVLFLCRLHPLRRIATLAPEVVRGAFERARELMMANLSGGMRSTTGQSGGGRTHVYGRLREDCPACGRRLSKGHHGPQLRVTWWCESCQPLVPPESSP